MGDFPAAARAIDQAIAARVTPAAVLEVGRVGEVLTRRAFGTLRYAPDAPACETDTIFDLASLTKVIATTSIAMHLFDEGRLALTDVAARAGTPPLPITFERLLDHSSGLPAHVPLYREIALDKTPHEAVRAAYRRAILHSPLAYPPGTQSVYSDLGFILLGFELETAGGAPLDQLFHQQFTHLTFRPRSEWRSRIAPTEITPEGAETCGVVHDENAAALGGVAGHAGLFGTARACGDFARLVLHTFREDSALATCETLRRFVRPSAVPGSSRALGWDTMRPTSSCGTMMSARAIGHTGFTGTSLWIDPDADVYVVLLTNRVHPSRHGEGIQALRRTVHDAVMTELR